jgi:hypothetical protein
MKPFHELTEELNEAGIQFLITDLNLAVSFLDMALLTANFDHRERLRRHARKGHDTVVRFLPHFICSQAQAAEIDSKLSHIRNRLECCDGRSSQANGASLIHA